MGRWLWSTYVLYILIIYTIVFLVKVAETRGINNNANIKRCTRHNSFGVACYGIIWLMLVMLAVTRNIELYPQYPSENGTIDMQAYLYFFRTDYYPGWNWSKILLLKQTEPLFFIISILVHSFTNNHIFLWLVIYSIVAFGFVFFIEQNYHKNMPLYILPVFFTAYLYSLSAIRTALSIAFAYVALSALKREKFWVRWISSILGFLSHYIIIVIFPCALFHKLIMKIKKNRTTWLKIGCICFVLGSFFIMEIVKNVIANTKYKIYLSVGSLTIVGQALVICLGILVLCFYDRLSKKYTKDIIYVHLVIFNLLLVPFIVNFNIYRINYYFLPIRIYVWGMLIRLIKQEFLTKDKASQRIVDCVVAIIAFLWLSKCIYDMRGIGIMPYYTNWL